MGAFGKIADSRDIRRWSGQRASVRSLVGILLLASIRGRSFKRQSTDKNAVMDLVIDPIDMSGTVPEQAFRFVTSLDTEIPTEKIRLCARHFIPMALADFDRVRSAAEFCRLFLERSQMQYRRFPFDAYVQHQ